MRLMETLNQCINAGHEMTKAIAIAQFNDDSPEARKITRRWRIGEAADLVGVSSQAIRDAEKAGRLPHPDMEIRGRVVIQLNKLIICVTCLVRDYDVLKTYFRR